MRMRFDSFVASQLVGARGHVAGVDLTPEVLEVARRASTAWPFRNIQFVEGSIENLPFEDRSFDLVISNGALNLVPDKDAAFLIVRGEATEDATVAGALELATPFPRPLSRNSPHRATPRGPRAAGGAS